MLRFIIISLYVRIVAAVPCCPASGLLAYCTVPLYKFISLYVRIVAAVPCCPASGLLAYCTVPLYKFIRPERYI